MDTDHSMVLSSYKYDFFYLLELNEWANLYFLIILENNI